MLLVDACRNDPASGRGRGIGTDLKVGDLPNNTAVFLSCSQGQRAYEDKQFGTGHGAFFYHVLVGMQGKGCDKQGRVTADSLWEYVREMVPADVAAVIKDGAEQKPFRLVTGDVDFQIGKKVTVLSPDLALDHLPANKLVQLGNYSGSYFRALAFTNGNRHLAALIRGNGADTATPDDPLTTRPELVVWDLLTKKEIAHWTIRSGVA